MPLIAALASALARCLTFFFPINSFYSGYFPTGLLTRHWSGKHGRVVQGINLITLLWTQGDSHIPCDYRFYEKSSDNATKNDHFRLMLETAKQRSFQPECIVFDGWYSSLENLKTIRGYSWLWLTRLKRNRLVNPDGTGNCSLYQVELAATGTVVHAHWIWHGQSIQDSHSRR